MKKIICLMVAIIISVGMVMPMVCMAKEETIAFNGVDIAKFDDVTNAELISEGGESFYEIDCPKGAKITILQPCTGIIASSIENETEFFLAPEGFGESVIDADGVYKNAPAGTTYVLDKATIYGVTLLFADGSYCDLIIYTDALTDEVNDDMPVMEEQNAVIPKPIDNAPNAIEVMPTSQAFNVDKEYARLTAYNINDNNYFKLRDIAWLITNYGWRESKKFEVMWDENKNAINLMSGQPYTEVGGEGKEIDGYYYAYAVPTNSTVYLNGEVISVTAYNINDNNYFKLRDICEALDIMTEWDEKTKEINLFTDYSYGHRFEN